MDVEPTGRFDWERVVRRTPMRAAMKLVALILATYADPDGTRVRPGNEALCADTGFEDRSVRRIMKELTAAGFLMRLSRGGGRDGRAATYRLSVPINIGERTDLVPVEVDSRPLHRAPQSAVDEALDMADPRLITVSHRSAEETSDPTVRSSSIHSPVDDEKYRTPGLGINGSSDGPTPDCTVRNSGLIPDPAVRNTGPQGPGTRSDQPPTATTIGSGTSSPLPRARADAEEAAQELDLAVVADCDHDPALWWFRPDDPASCSACENQRPPEMRRPALYLVRTEAS